MTRRSTPSTRSGRMKRRHCWGHAALSRKNDDGDHRDQGEHRPAAQMWRKELGRPPPTYENHGCTDDDQYQSKRPPVVVDVDKCHPGSTDRILQRQRGKSAENKSPT